MASARDDLLFVLIRGKYHLCIGSTIGGTVMFTVNDTLDEFEAVAKRLLELVEKERNRPPVTQEASMIDPDQVPTPTVPQPSQPAEDVTPDIGGEAKACPDCGYKPGERGSPLTDAEQNTAEMGCDPRGQPKTSS